MRLHGGQDYLETKLGAFGSFKFLYESLHGLGQVLVLSCYANYS